ncbi:UNVERIFIED_CONTAM: hypothetical protein K2H54_059370 [Gekko kuhli]
MLQSLAGSSCVRLVERHRSAWCFGLLVLGYLLYLVFGAVVFSSVELPYEDLLRQELRKLKRSFVEEHKCLSEAQLERFLARVLEASNYGVSVLSNASANWNWDFTSSLFFASTVLSTTGKEPGRAQAPPAYPPLAASAWGLAKNTSYVYVKLLCDNLRQLCILVHNWLSFNSLMKDNVLIRDHLDEKFGTQRTGLPFPAS